TGNYSYDEFVKDPEKFGSAERFLQLSIETVNDLGNHVVSDLKLGEVNWQSDIPSLLHKHGLVDERLAGLWMKMIGFRNILVNEYIDIDRKKVYGVIQSNLDDFRKIMAIFARWM
ncbi:MAG: DUF86 domain-containing protein, partial [Syntrophaceae bacterium]|nr:DUF86 domain-containing protein [Syntrophaceae bacterium]